MKSLIKNFLVSILGNQVRRLRKKNNFKIIGVVGSIGKTSTKFFIAKVLLSKYRVRFEEGNYNDILSVPLVFFGHKIPKLWNIFSWLKIIIQNEIQILFNYPFDFVVLELGTDGPGQINQFRKYLNLDVAVITAITPEHMEFFQDLNKVSEEEWSVSFFSDIVFANRDLCKIIPENVDHKKIVFYGKDFGSTYKLQNVLRTKEGFDFKVYDSTSVLNFSSSFISEVLLYSALISIVLAKKFEIPDEKIKEAVSKLASVNGRMNKLKGIKNSTIIDDTYNASPEAMKMALDTLYSFPYERRVAILGMMNELGSISEEEHRKLGEYCDPQKLDFVVTIGKDANLFLADSARKKGVVVYESKNAFDAGQIVKENMKEGSIILAKGSQNGVFAEEALKPLLLSKSDFSKLVRQDKNWMSKKQS